MTSNTAAEDIMSTAKKLVALFILGTLLTAIAVVALLTFSLSGYFHDAGPYLGNYWEGYTAHTFVGMALFTFATLPGFSLIYVSVMTGAHLQIPLFKVLRIIFGLACLALSGASWIWAYEMLRCGAVFCVGTHWNVDYPRPNAGLGWKTTVGVPAFICLLIVGLIVMFRVLQGWIVSVLQSLGISLSSSQPPIAPAASWDRVALLQSDSPRSPTPPPRPLGPPAHGPHRTSLMFDALVCVGTILVILLIGLITTYMPNSFEYFAAPEIASNARIHISQNYSLCNANYNDFTCPDLPTAIFTTTEWEVSDHLVLKFYPGNVFFFAYLCISVALAFCVRCSVAGRKLTSRSLRLCFSLHRVGTSWRPKISLSKPRSGPDTKVYSFSTSVGTLVMTMLTVLLIVLFSIYWFHDHDYNGYWTPKQDGVPAHYAVADSEVVARAFGQLAVLLFSLLLFPASRTSPLHHIFGTSWEGFIWAHRTLGGLMLAAAFAHMVAWFVKYQQVGLFPKDIFDVPMHLPTSIDNYTVPLNTLTTWTLFICMGVFAYDSVRRTKFELFYYTHLFAAYAAIPAVLWHAAAGWEYMLPGLTVWFIDRVIRFTRSSRPVTVTAIKHFEGVTEVRFVQESLVVKPGHYVFVNIPEVSIFEWHPFTVSSSSGSEVSIHVKVMGAGTWTERLNSLAKWMEVSARPVHSVAMSVDGPYGHPIDYSEFEQVYLVSGGIGITPSIAIYNSLMENGFPGSATLIWSLRETPMFRIFKSRLCCFERFSAKTYFTKGMPSDPDLVGSPTGSEKELVVETKLSGPQCPMTAKAGRPNFEDEIVQGAATAPHRVLVFACGPPEMVESLSFLAADRGFTFHQETFLL